ncbi:MAG: hypothetical protein LAT84_13890 [Balneolia bacterium]|nr:hypothetical protein [Balneolia bacterium]
MIRPDYIPPSLLVEGIYCGRRLWLKANHVEAFDEVMELARATSLKDYIYGISWDDSGWVYEARLPSGSRMDAWIAEDQLGIEFKSGTPHPTHLYQVWAIRQELDQLGVKGAELQLWYQSSFGADAAALANEFGLEHGEIDSGIYAICADSDDPDFCIRLERNAAVLLGDLEKESMPAAKDPSSAVCRRCSYQAFCYS